MKKSIKIIGTVAILAIMIILNSNGIVKAEFKQQELKYTEGNSKIYINDRGGYLSSHIGVSYCGYRAYLNKGYPELGDKMDFLDIAKCDVMYSMNSSFYFDYIKNNNTENIVKDYDKLYKESKISNTEQLLETLVYNINMGYASILKVTTEEIKEEDRKDQNGYTYLLVYGYNPGIFKDEEMQKLINDNKNDDSKIMKNLDKISDTSNKVDISFNDFYVMNVYNGKYSDSSSMGIWNYYLSDYVKSSSDICTRLDENNNKVFCLDLYSGEDSECKYVDNDISTRFIDPVMKIEISGENELKEGDKTQLKATITPSDAKDQTLIWKSSNNNIATVSENGEVIAKKAGVVTITAQSSNNNIAKHEITVKAVETIKIIGENKVKVGGKITLHAMLEDIENKNVTWESSNEDIATIDNNGNIIGISEGKATITATTEDGKIAEHEVTVETAQIATSKPDNVSLISKIISKIKYVIQKIGKFFKR